MRDLDINYELKAFDHGSFIPGRCAEIVVEGKTLGYFGELHPEVITAFELEYPVVALEINLELF